MRRAAIWDERFLRIARFEIAGWSKDPDEKVGCVIVSPDRRSWTAGYNGLPVKVKDSAERLADHDLKNRLSVHAELNAILNARTDLAGWTLYVTKPPCLDCAKAIIQAGVTRAVCPRISQESRWSKEQRDAVALLSEAGVRVTTYLIEKERPR